MSGSAAEQVGSDADFLFLAGDQIEVDVPLAQAWRLLEGDHQERLLRALSSRFTGREVIEELAGGYRCTTTSRARLGRRRSFESVVWLDEPHRSVELQTGQRTELRYTTTYEPTATGTIVRCEQAYRARSTSLESGAAIGALQRRATTVVADRLRAAGRVLEG